MAQQGLIEEQVEERQEEEKNTETPANDAGVSDSGPEQPPEPQSDEDAFARLFDEADEQPPDPPEAPPEGAAEGESPETPPEEGGVSGSEEVQAPEATAGEQPEEQTQAEHSGKPERPPDTEIQAEPEWWTDLPDEAKQQIGQLQEYANHQFQSNSAMHGRLAPVQRENAYLKEQLRKNEEAQATAPTLKDLEESNAYKAITDEFPEESKELKNLFTSQARVIQQANQGHQRYQHAIGQVQQTYKARELQRLSQVVPEYLQLLNHPRFQQWKQAVVQRPDMFGDMRQKLTSDFYEDSVDVLNSFRQHWAQAYPDEFGSVYPQAQAGQSQANGQPQPQAKTPQRPKPPNPSPPSQGAGVSGTTRKHPPQTAEERYAALFDD